MDDPQDLLLAFCGVDGVSWHVIARAAKSPEGLHALADGESLEHSTEAAKTAALIREARGTLEANLGRARSEIEAAWRRADARLVTVLDDEYPANLRLVFNPPPFLFVRGTLKREDLRSVAVVGTREASPDGLRRAGKMARALVAEGVTVVSGLARGIDTAAHEATLAASGRTIAVIGTGILRTYPSENKELAERVTRSGALVSQFWPSSPPARWTFPRRNVTMSGISQGTAVIEAGKTSGAKLQARFAAQHGKLVFLVESLVTHQEWAQKMLAKDGAIQVREPSEVVERLRSADRVQAVADGRRQLTLSLADE